LLTDQELRRTFWCYRSFYLRFDYAPKIIKFVIHHLESILEYGRRFIRTCWIEFVKIRKMYEKIRKYDNFTFSVNKVPRQRSLEYGPLLMLHNMIFESQSNNWNSAKIFEKKSSEKRSS
jgi:hypothetical protein